MNTVFEQLGDQELLTLAIRGEAGGEGLDGMLAVGSVIMNRVHEDGWYGKSIHDVILKPKQFSCFNEDNPVRPKLLVIAKDFEVQRKKDRNLMTCWFIAWGVLQGYLQSNVGRATHYHTIKCNPTWDDDMKLVCVVGKHMFYQVQR